MTYVRVPSGDVGVLQATDSRATNGKYFVAIKGMNEITNHNDVTVIDETDYNAYQPKPVETTKPKAARKKA